MLKLSNIESSAVNALSVDKDRQVAQVEYTNGGQYTYFDVDKGAIASLLEDQAQSFGQWVNTNLLNDELVSYETGYTFGR